MEAGKIAEFLKNSVPLFKNFSADRLAELVQGSRHTTFAPNEAIIRFGEEGTFLGIILQGEAVASVTDDSGQTHQLGTLGPGEVIGEFALMTGDKTMADVIGLTLCELLLIPQSLFSTMLITNPQAIQFLSKNLSERLRKIALDESEHVLAVNALKKSDDPYGLNLKSDEPMKLLVINCGSSSLKYNLFDTANTAREVRGLIEKIGEAGTRHVCRSQKGEFAEELPQATHREAFAAMVQALMRRDTGAITAPDEISAVGHRVVHGGDRYSGSVVITEDVLRTIESLAGLAPLHNPVNLVGITEAQKLFPKAPHVAVFDTAFHQTMPPYAYLYGLPYQYYQEKKIRRYGFHGMSHSYVALKAAEYLKRPFNSLEIVSCHLGNGASICAVDHGRSIDTSMGLTPIEGLLMGTRSGSVDPGAIVHLIRNEKLDDRALDTLLNKSSGLKGISGLSNDMREIEAASQEGHHQALLAFKTFCYQIRKYIGAYVAAMGGLDVLIFTGGIGQGSAGVRSLACQGLAYMGIQIDEKKNTDARCVDTVCDLSADGAPVRVLAVPTNEERMIARETIKALNRHHVTTIIQSQKPMRVPVEISAHHIHLSQPHVEKLFGQGHQLTPDTELSQPGQFACREKVNLIGPKGRVERVRVLGPARKDTQLEISMTEQFKLGVHPPIRESGDIENTPGIRIEGDRETISIDKGVICAMRHIHMTPEDALQFGLKDKDIVLVRLEGDRELIFGDVLVRVHPNYRLAMHIDTDEGNAANIKTGDIGYIQGIQSRR